MTAPCIQARHSFLPVGALLALAASLPAGEPAPAGPGVARITVRLRPAVLIHARTVRVADVAELSGGPAPLRDQAGRLDLVEATSSASALLVSGKQVSFRLRLAGLPEHLFRVEGQSCRVAVAYRTLSADRVVAAARQELLRGLPWAPPEVRIDLAQPLVAALPAVADDEELRIMAQLRPGSRPPGRVQMDVQLIVEGKNRLSLPLYFDVRPCVAVVVCRRRVEKGQVLGADDIYIEQQPVTDHSRQCLNPALLKGGRARRALLPGQVVLIADVEGPGHEAADAILVRAQEAVKMRARVGNLQVTAAGQSLQEGRRGQLIRVQNIDSKKVLQARVIDRSLVEVE